MTHFLQQFVFVRYRHPKPPKVFFDTLVDLFDLQVEDREAKLLLGPSLDKYHLNVKTGVVCEIVGAEHNARIESVLRVMNQSHEVAASKMTKGLKEVVLQNWAADDLAEGPQLSYEDMELYFGWQSSVFAETHGEENTPCSGSAKSNGTIQANRSSSNSLEPIQDMQDSELVHGTIKFLAEE